MKYAFGIVVLFFILFQSSAQSSRLSVKKRKSHGFAMQISQSTLVVAVKDKQDAEGKAMAEAVKKYWKISKYELVAEKDLEATFAANVKAQKECMYLVRESYHRRKARKKDWSFTKYYLSVNPSFAEVWGDPYLQFKLPVKATDKENPEPLNSAFLYGLMMRHLNREVLYMQDPAKYGKVSRRRLYKATFEGSLKAYADRDLLVSKKELDNFMINLPEEKKTKVQEEKFFKYLAKKLKIKPERIKLVTDEQVKKAVEMQDKKALVYTGFTVFKADDAAMLRRIDPHRSNRIAFNITFTISLIVAVAAALAVISYF